MLNLRSEEITAVVCVIALHLGFAQTLGHLKVPKIKPKPMMIELVHPQPKLIEKPKEVPQPKLIEAPPKPEPPKPPKAKPKKPIKKPVIKKVVFKPRLQQHSVVQTHVEEVVEQEVVQHAEPVHAKVVEAPKHVEEAPEPPHKAVVTKPGGIGSCAGTLNHYPSEAREEGVEGTVKLKVHVSASGGVSSASISKSSGSSILDQSALSNVYDCNFEPATKDGEPISSTVIIPVRFRLD